MLIFAMMSVSSGLVWLDFSKRERKGESLIHLVVTRLKIKGLLLWCKLSCDIIKTNTYQQS